MQKLQQYYSRFFGSRTSPVLLPTRLSDWKNEFVHTFGLETFGLRILKALLLNQKVVIYADYDTDAVCATSVLYWGLIGMGFAKENIDYYAPDRFGESYGLNIPAVEKLAKLYDLMITVDCGINSVEEVEAAKSLGMEVIITDHHQIKDTLPDALGVINPQLGAFLKKNATKRWQKKQVSNQESVLMSLRNYISSDEYLASLGTRKVEGWTLSLVGAGVAWMSLVYTSYWLQEVLPVLHGIDPKLKKVLTRWTPKKLEPLLSFVAIATIADSQSIADPTNRLLVQVGLKYLNLESLPYPGIAALLEGTGLGEKMKQGYTLNSQDLGFTISPILNASGRIAHVNHSMKAMLAWEMSEAKKEVATLLDLNKQRKDLVAKAMVEVDLQIKKTSNFECIIVGGKWSKGIVGLIASRITSTYGVPSFVISTDGEEYSGSARSPLGYDLVSWLSATKDLLIAFGGHAQAAGFRMPNANYNEFVSQMHSTMPAKDMSHITSYPLIGVDGADPRYLEVLSDMTAGEYIYVEPHELTPALGEKIWKLDPFGQSFPLPLLLVVLDKYRLVTMGKENNHLKISVGTTTVTRFFVTKEEQKILAAQKTVLCVVKPSINVFRSKLQHEWIVEKIIPIIA